MAIKQTLYQHVVAGLLAAIENELYVAGLAGIPVLIAVLHLVGVLGVPVGTVDAHEEMEGS